MEINNYGALPLYEQHDQQCFVEFKKVHVVLYTSQGSNTQLLLRKKPKTQKFVDFSGKLNTIDDPSILFSAARKLYKKTAGLVSNENIQYFLENTHEVDTPKLDASHVEVADHTVQLPKRMKDRIYQEYLEKVSNTNYLYQIPSCNTAVYFVEIPAINVSKLNDFCKERNLPFEFLLADYDDITDGDDDRISEETKSFLSQSGLSDFIQDYIIDEKPIAFSRNYGVFCCEPNVVNFKYQGLYYTHLKKFGENWRFYHICEFDMPTEEEIEQFDAVVLPGSSLSAYAAFEWKDRYFDILRNIKDNYPNILMLGVCFGAQSMAQAFGGKVEKMPNAYVRGSEPLTIKSTFFELPYVKGLDIKKTGELVISESHGDHITKLPPDAVLHASSRRTNTEIYTIGDRVLAWQGHPEYTKQWTAGVVYQLSKASGDFTTFSKDCDRKFFPEAIDHDDLMRILHNFVKRTIN